ncbi:MAG: T9SS type A sorting domain-containing protein [Bacteroidales bacterium]|jgi:hypothetical protein|nr:T9SS type A sorting domain-containing protein [Bacteroidales bacterium]
MKKLLLLLIAASFAISASAQQTAPVKMAEENLLFDSPDQGQVHFPAEINYSGTKDVSRIDIGTAHSQRSFRREDCPVISYNKDLDLVSVTFIIDQETYPEAISDGTVATFYSEDHGMTWNGPVVLSDLSSEGLRNYYPSGIIYNPTGNTVVADAYGVYQGSAPDEALADWSNQAFGSSTFGGANYETYFFTNTDGYDGYFSQFGLTQIEDYVKAFNILSIGDWSAFTSLGMEDIQGTFNGTGFDWDLENSVVDFPFNIDPADGEAMWVGKYTFSDVAAGLVWSDDGMIGYTWMVGSDENDPAGVEPIIFRTADGGNNWDQVDYDFQDEEWQEFFRDGATEPTDWLIYPCRDAAEEYTDFCIPWFNGTVGAVDSDGNLQLFGDLTSGYYDIFNDWEYYENYLSRYNYTGHLFKFTFGEELIDITWVDSLRSGPAVDLTSGSNDSLYCGTSGWLRRLQLTKDERSEEFFVTWTDTRDGNNVVENYKPDVMGWSFNSTTGTNTDPFCYTCGTLFENFYWYVQAAERAIYDPVAETFTVPYLNAVTISDFQNNGTASADPVGVQYVTGITFDAIVPIPVSVDELSGQTNTVVSQNIPNPATGNTLIEISSDAVAPVKVEVSNMIGQTVYSVDAGVINGSMQVTIDVSNFEAGVYFYTVIIENERISNKMIVK